MACTAAACGTTRVVGLGKRPSPAGSAAWEEAVRGQLLARFDDGSKALSPAEVAKIPCEVWQDLEADLKRDTSDGLAVTYGFEPQLLWRGDRLGLAPGARATALDVTTRCVGARTEHSTDATMQALLDVSDPPTSDPWDRAVASILVRTFDDDRSGRIDEAAEVDAIPCSVWGWLDSSVATVSRYPMVSLYGFANGYAWAAGALGFDHRVRDDAEVALGRCGIATDL